MQNTVALKEGDALMLYVEKLPDAEPEALIPIAKPTSAPATKRRKTGKSAECG